MNKGKELRLGLSHAYKVLLIFLRETTPQANITNQEQLFDLNKVAIKVKVTVLFTTV